MLLLESKRGINLFICIQNGALKDVGQMLHLLAMLDFGTMAAPPSEGSYFQKHPPCQ